MQTEQNKLSSRGRLLLLAAGLLALNSCATLNLLRSDIRAMNHDSKIVGRVAGTDSGTVKILVCKKLPDREGLTIADSASPNSLGDFVFLMPRGKSYFLAAVKTPDRGARGDSGSVVSFYGGKTPEVVPAMKDPTPEPLILNFARKIGPENPLARDLLEALDNWKEKPGAASGAVPIACGEIAALDDAVFDTEAGQNGMWAPVTSAKRNGLGIYFLRPYDPVKIPVVFVHGIGGTPRSWKKIIESLDPDRYQPWVYSYPSGIPIESAAQGLASLADRLQRHHGFGRMHVVAHSMGGLVARRAVQILSGEERKGYVASLTTISTPWNGVTSAALGSVGLPFPVPSWLDLRPNSKFIRKALADPLPVPHLLIATEKSSFRLMLAHRNDGTVSVASQMDPRAVSKATTCVMVPQNHTGVLEAGETRGALGAFLKQTGRDAPPRLPSLPSLAAAGAR